MSSDSIECPNCKKKVDLNLDFSMLNAGCQVVCPSCRETIKLTLNSASRRITEDDLKKLIKSSAVNWEFKD